jgi:hypothetical protein
LLFPRPPSSWRLTVLSRRRAGREKDSNRVPLANESALAAEGKCRSGPCCCATPQADKNAEVNRMPTDREALQTYATVVD